MAKLPEPEYINLEYWFNKFFELLVAIPALILKFLDWLSQFNLKFISIALSSLLGAGIIIVIYNIIALRRSKIVSYIDFFAGEEMPETRLARWDEIKRHLGSENPVEWKMAVIEADSLLDDILKKIGYKGDTLAERLKNIEPSDLENLQNIWEGHKIRNRLVHEPGKFEFTRGEAENTIEKYEEALRELKYI